MDGPPAATGESPMDIRFWGVRGSIAVSGPRYTRTGGNTTCVELSHDGARLILDGGTGLRALGESLGFAPLEATLLFTHLHWDHIQGVPFFGPAFHPESRLTLAGVPRATGTVREALAAQMRPPTFPVTLDRLVGARRFVDVPRTGPLEFGPFRVTPLEQDHPDGVVAYRIEAGGRSVVFATDCEHREGAGESSESARAMAAFARGADVLIHDAQYTTDEYFGRRGPPRLGWGHSTVDDAVAVARRADCGRLALFHHDPGRDDDAVEALERVARAHLPGAFAAREGEGLTL